MPAIKPSIFRVLSQNLYLQENVQNGNSSYAFKLELILPFCSPNKVLAAQIEENLGSNMFSVIFLSFPGI